MKKKYNFNIKKVVELLNTGITHQECARKMGYIKKDGKTSYSAWRFQFRKAKENGEIEFCKIYKEGRETRWWQVASGRTF